MKKKELPFHLAALSSLLLLQLACHDANRGQEKVELAWRQHEKIFIDLRNGKDVKAADFNEACLFFSQLTDVEIPSSHNLFVDCYPTNESYKALEPLRGWYSRNHYRLYWNEASMSVKLRN